MQTQCSFGLISYSRMKQWHAISHSCTLYICLHCVAVHNVISLFSTYCSFTIDKTNKMTWLDYILTLSFNFRSVLRSLFFKCSSLSPTSVDQVVPSKKQFRGELWPNLENTKKLGTSHSDTTRHLVLLHKLQDPRWPLGPRSGRFFWGTPCTIVWK